MDHLCQFAKSSLPQGLLDQSAFWREAGNSPMKNVATIEASGIVDGHDFHK
jgi:hypothetical protein